MQIANPMYDSVFKFLMEDTDSAILLLSTIIGETIESLDFLPLEKPIRREQRSFTVYRLDLCAKIKVKQGYKQVLIEIQKAKFPSDIMRFRRYLGEQYSKKSNVYTVRDKDQEYKKPIISIYFLGYPLEHVKVPVIKVNRQYHDVANNEKTDIKEEFIESLTHDSYIIQISQLRQCHQTEVEQVLAIFDQGKHLASYEHILDIDEEKYPVKYYPLIHRLQRAIAEPKIRKTMNIEDDVLECLQDMERLIEEKENMIKEQDKVLKEQDKALKEKDKTLKEQDKALKEQDKALKEQDKALEKKDSVIREKNKE